MHNPALKRDAAKALGKEAPKTLVLSKFMFKFLGIFVSPIRESIEILYQNEFDYVFDSSKFERVFGVKPTSYEIGIMVTIKSIREEKMNK